MTVFFFVVGLEIKQELTNGQLTSPRDAAVPAAGALGGMGARRHGGPGGMVVPAAWWSRRRRVGIPIATDVAFVLGVLALLDNRVPAELKVLLLGIAILDDIGAIIVIAAFYSDGLDARRLAAAGAGLLFVALVRRIKVRYLPVYVVLGSGIWLATFESGVHATIAGVALGLLAPARSFLPEVDADRIAGTLSTDQHVTAAEVRDISFRLRESIRVTERLQGFLHPWTSYLIVPLFALANAGVAGAIARVTRLGIGRLPDGISTCHIVGMAAIAGIGFTVSIFVDGLAFNDPALGDQATIGVLAASLLAAVVGSTILRAGAPVEACKEHPCLGAKTRST